VKQVCKPEVLAHLVGVIRAASQDITNGTCTNCCDSVCHVSSRADCNRCCCCSSSAPPGSETLDCCILTLQAACKALSHMSCARVRVGALRVCIPARAFGCRAAVSV
jgi:hypothetical protein